MPATILTSQHYNSVRGLIAPDVTTEDMSDDFLSQDPFAPAAEREVRRRLSAAEIDVDTLTGDVLNDARLAMIYACVAELSVSVAQTLRDASRDIQTEVQNINWKDKRALSLEKVEEYVSNVIAAQAEKRSGTRSRPAFVAAGTERREPGEPTRPYRRVVYTYND